MLKETRNTFRDNVRKTMQHKYFGPPAKLTNVYPPNFSPRKDVSYLFEEESKADKKKRKIYEHNPFETRYTAKMHNYAQNIEETENIRDTLVKYIESKHDMSA